jgi:hypothetical protein
VQRRVLRLGHGACGGTVAEIQVIGERTPDVRGKLASDGRDASYPLSGSVGRSKIYKNELE